MNEIRVRSQTRSELIEITTQLQQTVAQSGVAEGVVVVQSLHTTAAITVNENADPDVQHDLVQKLSLLAPRRESFYRHAEGNSDSHFKTSLFGPSLTLIVHEGRILLGTWQGVYLCEFDGPRERRVAVQLLRGAGVEPGDRGP